MSPKLGNLSELYKALEGTSHMCTTITEGGVTVKQREVSVPGLNRGDFMIINRR